MSTDVDLKNQSAPVQPEAASGGPTPSTKRPRLKRAKAWLRFWRMKVAKAILLPELTGTQAQELRQTVRHEGALTRGYVLMCGLSAGIATLGLLQSSTAVVIGAMLISPLMSPIAALGFGFASLDGKRIRDAARVVAVGAAIGILVGVLITWLSPIRNATPEILARTQPTLLDLAVALFSGIAGGYATVIQKGGTAIGVAIATALMPPLAVVGYGLGVLQIQFALGAFLLFLTNLAAITFSFALIARLSNAARPLAKVEWRPRHVAFGVLAFLVLATPLTMTLNRITQEAKMRSEAKSAIEKACGGKEVDIAQLEVSWPLFDDPTVDALVVAPTYSPNAESDAESFLAEALGENVLINLQQVQAADFQSQTRAMIDAAMERTTAGIAANVPPFDKIRASIGLPTRAIWHNTAERRVYVEPIPAPDWTLTDYGKVELQANEKDSAWNVRIIPPPQPTLRVALGDPATAPDDTVSPRIAGWALLRWGMNRVTIDAPDGEKATAFIKGLADSGITAVKVEPSANGSRRDDPDNPVAILTIYSRSPTVLEAEARARAEAKAKAEAEEKAREEAAANKAE